MNRKGIEWFSAFFILAVIFLFTMASIQLLKERKGVDRAIGQLQADVLSRDQEMQQLSVYSAIVGERSALEGVETWAKDGFLDGEPCGSYGGYPLWRQRGATGINDCFPVPAQSMPTYLQAVADRQLQALPYAKNASYEVSVVGHKALGIPLRKAFNPLSDEDKFELAKTLPSNEQECLASGKVPYFLGDTFISCGSCYGSCGNYKMDYCMLDPCHLDCSWQGDSCIQSGGMSFAFQPSFEEDLPISADDAKSLVTTFRALADGVATCSGPLDGCIQDQLDALNSPFDISQGPCEQIPEEDFAEQMDRCVASPNCVCSATASSALSAHDGKLGTLILPLPLTFTVSQGEKIFFTQDHLVSQDDSAIYPSCPLDDRHRRFCVNLRVPGLDGEMKLHLALYFPDDTPPPPLEDFTAVDHPRAESMLLLHWKQSADASLYRVYFAKKDISDLSREALWSDPDVTILNLTTLNLLDGTLADDCRVLALGSPCTLTLTKDSPTQVELVPRTLYRAGDTMSLALPVPSDGGYYVGATAVDDQENEIDNLGQKMPVLLAQSTDDLAPAPPQLFTAVRDDTGVSFSLRFPTENEDGTAIKEPSLSAIISTCPISQPLATLDGAPGQLKGTLPLQSAVTTFCAIVKDSLGNPSPTWEEYPLLVKPSS